MEDGIYLASELSIPRKVEKRHPAIEYLITGAIMAGFIFGIKALDQKLGKNIARYNAYSNTLVDNTTSKTYTVTQETERNHWDNLDYQVRTGRLVLEER
jgi:hypothetical protein